MSISFPPPPTLDSHPADLPSATTLRAYPCHPTTTRNTSPTASRELCPSLASCAFRSSRLLLQPMLHTSLQGADTTNTLPRHSIGTLRPKMAQFSQASSKQLSTTPSYSWHSGDASRRSKHPHQPVQSSGIIRTSSTTAKATLWNRFETFCHQCLGG